MLDNGIVNTFMGVSAFPSGAGGSASDPCRKTYFQGHVTADARLDADGDPWPCFRSSSWKRSRGSSVVAAVQQTGAKRYDDLKRRDT